MFSWLRTSPFCLLVRLKLQVIIFWGYLIYIEMLSLSFKSSGFKYQSHRVLLEGISTLVLLLWETSQSSWRLPSRRGSRGLGERMQDAHMQGDTHWREQQRTRLNDWGEDWHHLHHHFPIWPQTLVKSLEAGPAHPRWADVKLRRLAQSRKKEGNVPWASSGCSSASCQTQPEVHVPALAPIFRGLSFTLPFLPVKCFLPWDPGQDLVP